MKTALSTNLNWDLKTETLLIPGSKETKRKIILRDDNSLLLGVVGKDYCPVTNADLMYFVKAIVKTGEFDFNGFHEINDGKVILAFLQNKNPNLKLNNCPMREYLIIGNSHDGTRPFYIGTGSSLIRCENQFYSTLKVFKRKHTSPISMSDVEVREIIKVYKQKKNRIYEAFDGMEEAMVTDRAVEQLIKEIHKMLATDSTKPKDETWGQSPSMNLLRQSIYKEMRDLGNNAFGLFNGVTWYTSHEMRNAGSDFGRLNGTANRINQKAYRFCMALKNASNKEVELIIHN